MATVKGGNVVLGFVEKVEPWKLLSRFFPHKIGGKPAWLALDNLPTIDDLKCGKCGEICVFLMQLYSPLQNLTPSAFHRTLFLFICRNPDCCENNSTDNLVVLRSQLPIKNKFYSDLPPNEDDFDPNVNNCFQLNDSCPALCSVCGCLGKWKCGKCKEVNYCSQGHQKLDWKAGHKRRCGRKDASEAVEPDNTSILFPEYNLLAEINDDDSIEEEKGEDLNQIDSEDSEDEADDSDRKEDRMSECNEIACKIAGQNSDLSTEELEQMASNVKDDRQFGLFKQMMQKEPEQVVRFELDGQPLWVSSNHIPQISDIPPCQFCHSSRQFEFQVMSTLLNHLDVDCVKKSIDWGTLVVYTCSKSCIEGGNYGKEFVWKQDFDG